MGNPSLDIPVERRRRPTASTRQAAAEQTVCVASFGDPVAEDYADFARIQGSGRVQTIDLRGDLRGEFDASGRSLVLFLKPRLSAAEKTTLDRLLAEMASGGECQVCIVSTFRVHLGNAAALEAEQHIVCAAKRLGLRPTVFRPGHVLSDRSPLVDAAARWGCCYPLVPPRLRSCFVTGSALFGVIEQERLGQPTRSRTHTMLGANLPWREVLASHRATGPLSTCLEVISSILALVRLGEIAGLFITLLAKRLVRWRALDVSTLKPATFRDLRALYSPYNYRQVKIVGYNNGVNHFGHRYPGRTIVSTVNLSRVVRAGAEIIRADCGATVRKARDVVLARGQDLPVIPNYSYVCLGTAFFVPIHGSASDYSCVAETITRAILYDPCDDRLIIADQDSPEFGGFAYDTHSQVLLLRLYCQVKPKATYFLRTQEFDAPAASDLLEALRDKTAANVEIRKPSASETRVTIYRYYTQTGDAPSPTLAVARDSIGKVWDRLEENPITSFLMHALTRHLAFHVELFFTFEQFGKFWETHRGVPLRKIQLRYIRADGLPNSAFCDQDCVSADMFMFRRHRHPFERYLEQTSRTLRRSGESWQAQLLSEISMTTTETAAPSRLSDTLGRMLRDRRPNLFRLYLNPFVTQACFCLDRYVRSTWTARADAPDDPYPSFLANSFDEALGGAIKLARYCLTLAGKSTDGLVLDFEDRVGSFTEIELSDGGRIELIPGLKVVKNARDLADVGQKFGLVVLASGLTDESFECVERLVRRDEALLVMRVTRQSLAELRRGDSPALARLRPDMVVFDESFVNREVPFGAFSARGVLYDHWKARGPGQFSFHHLSAQYCFKPAFHELPRTGRS